MRPAFYFLLALALASPLAAAETHSLQIKEWPVPWPNSRPTDPVPVRPDTVWFVGETGNYLATLNPETGAFKRIDLIDEPGPQSMVVAGNGIVWFTGTARGYIGRFDPRSRQIARIPMPYAAAADPHTLIMELGERNIWFTLQASNMIARLRIDSSTVDLIALRTPNAAPDGIASAPNGSPWFALSGVNKIGTVDPRTFVLTEYALLRTDARPRRIAFTTDGRLWYGDFAEGYLGMFTPDGGGAAVGAVPAASANSGKGAEKASGTGARVMKEWPLPAGKTSHPYGLAVDSKDRVWIVETGTQPNKLVGFDPKTERFFSSTAVPSGGGTVRDLHYDRASNGLWFGTDANTIGYAKLD